MKTHLKMTALRVSLLLCVAGASSQYLNAQSWTGGDIGNSQNWSDANNWAGNVAPSSGSAVIFPDGLFPVTTNVQGVVNNIVQSSTTVASLTFNNAASHFDTTLIPSGVILTESGNLIVGGTVPSTVTVTGGGSLVGGSGTSTATIQSTSGTAVLDLSPLTNFIFNATGNGAAFSLSTGSSSASGRINLAAGSNYIVATTLSLGNNNTGGTGTMNLGNGTNIIRADTVSMGVDKTTGTMQFLNNAGGGLMIANHTGTGRATVTVSGVASSGGTGSINTGNLLLDGGTVNILAGTLTVGSRGNRPDHSGTGSPTGGALGMLAFNNGVVDANFVNMATNASGGGFATGTIAVGGPGTLKVGTAGFSLVNQGSSAADPANGTLIVTNGGSVICAGSIFKGTAQGAGTGVVWVADSSLSVGITIGATNANPIDYFNITNSTLTLPAATSANVLVVNLNADATTQNTINISSMPTISSFPSQFPIISYQVAAGNLNSFVLGTLPGLPGTFKGYISNNTTSLTIDLVVTNGPVAKADQWGGGINNLWDTTTLNWTNAGAAVNYNDLDLVTFNDLASSGTVSLPSARVPASLTVNNSVLNYTFNGAGKISGSVGLDKEGTASLTLADTGGDNFTGGILANAGTLILDNANSAISGGLTVGGGATVQVGNNDAAGSLPSGILDNEGTIIFARSDNIQVGTVIPGGGAVSQNGSGRLALSAANTYSGTTTVNAGTLALTNAGAIASSSGVTVNSNATLDVSGVTTSATLAALNLSNATLNVKVGYLQTNFTASTVTMTGSTNIINVRSLPPIASYPATVALLQSPSAMTGFNLGLGSLPAGVPANVGTIALSGDQTAVLLTLTAGPVGVRPTVTWSGADALANINTNWSDAQNWQTPGVPAAGEKIVFNDTAAAGGSPFDVAGDGVGGIINPANIDNIVDLNATNAGVNYANTSFHNTLINSGKTLAVNGALTVNGSAGNVAILGTNGTLVMNNPSNSTTLNVENGTAPTLDLSGLDTFTATVNQVGVGFNAASAAFGSGTCYLARTNKISTGFGNSGSSASLVVSGSGSGTTGKLYLGQTNALFLDGVAMGIGQSVNNLIAFNPAVTNQNPYAFIRGLTGNSSRVSVWSIGDATVNLNNGTDGQGHVVDFSGGTLNALIGTLIVGQGAQGNTFNTQLMGTFNMGAGNLDVTSLQIGAGDNGKNGGSGIGIMNVTGGTLVANSLSLGVGGPTNTTGTLNLTNASVVLSNGVTIGANTAGGTLSVIGSTLKVLSGTLGTPALPLTALNLDSATLQLNADGSAPAANVVCTNIIAANLTTINLGAVANVAGSAQIPLVSYAGTDPYPNLTLGTVPSGYTIGNGGLLVDNTANLTIDVIINGTAAPTTNANILSVTLSGTNLILHGTNNNGGQNFRYAVLTSTNVAIPLSNWTALGTNPFNPDGTFDYTNPIVPSQPRGFFDIQVVP